MKRLLLIAAILILFSGSYSCKRQSENPAAENEIAILDSTVTYRLLTRKITAPVQLNADPEQKDRVFITDLKGKIWILKNDSLLTRPFLDISLSEEAQKESQAIGNIYGVAFHPEYSANHKFYVFYSAAAAIAEIPAKLVVSEFRTSDGDADFADPQTERPVIEFEWGNVFANGGAINFGPDGYLYISIGDEGFGAEDYVHLAQNLTQFSGKLLRIDVNQIPYGIPPDNPFVGSNNAKPEIWAYGFRKLWRYSFDPLTGQLIGGDVGEGSREEINIITKGGNYGWPIMEGDSIFTENDPSDKSTMIPPVFAYSHKVGICAIGGGFYRGNAVPYLRDKYVFGDHKGSLFAISKDDKNQWTKHPLKVNSPSEDPFLINSLNTDQNDELYVMGFLNTLEGPGGVVYKIVSN